MNPSARPSVDATHFVPAQADEIAGWAHVKTDQTALPKAVSREELVLKALTEACQTSNPESGFDACAMMQSMVRYSFKTWLAPGPNLQADLAKHDLVGTVPVDKFYDSYVVPALRSSADRLPVRAQMGVLQLLVGWKDEDASAKLSALRNRIKP